MTNAAEYYVLEQPASRASAVLSFAVFLPAACSIFVPFGLAATEAAAVVHAVQQQPVAAAQVALGLVVWTLLFLIPVVRRLKGFGLSRSVTIADRQVIEVTRTLFGSKRRQQSLQAFNAIVHRVRTSVGGMTHELALIEAGSDREVVFAVAAHVTRADVERAVRTLGLPEIRAADLLHLPAAVDLIRFSAPQSASAVA